MEFEVRLQKRWSQRGKYKTYSITLPAQIITQIPKLKRAKKVKLDINLLGNIEIKI